MPIKCNNNRHKDESFAKTAFPIAITKEKRRKMKNGKLKIESIRVDIISLLHREVCSTATSTKVVEKHRKSWGGVTCGNAFIDFKGNLLN